MGQQSSACTASPHAAQYAAALPESAHSVFTVPPAFSTGAAPSLHTVDAPVGMAAQKHQFIVWG
jgi:hypothetical protein